MYEPYKRHLISLQGSGKYRKLPEVRQANKQDYLDFSTNDYLALSQNSEIIEAGIAASKKYGAGATGSRALSGNSTLFEEFEAKIAQDKHTKAALIFSSGFQANFSALAALLDAKVLGTKPIVFFDKLNHASLYQAIFASAPELVRYNHNDINQLEFLLCKYSNDNRPKFIVTETLFGMDGDVLPLEQVALIAKQHNAFLYLDEAHATGIFGKAGYGLATEVNLNDIAHAIMGTFSKALGCSGGYIACSSVIRDYLVNKASGFIYSTAPSPAAIGAAAQAWEIVRALHHERKQLLLLSDFLRENLQQAGFNIGKSCTHIVPIILGQETITMRAKAKLYAHKIIVSAIRPPTVAPNSSRLRIALTTRHQAQDVDQLIHALTSIL